MVKQFGHEGEFSPQHGGKRYIFKFPNGFGASVIQNRYSYGGDRGLWELAVLDSEGHLTYGTEITSDVIGYLSEGEVQETLNRIKALKPISEVVE